MYFQDRPRKTSPEQRVIVSKFVLMAVALLAALVAGQRPSDILPMVAASFSLAASAFVPAMVLGIFWRGVTRYAALAGMLAGLGVALYYMLSHTAMVQHWLPSVLLADGLWWGIQPVSSGVFGVAAGMAVTLLWSWVGPRESLQR